MANFIIYIAKLKTKISDKFPFSVSLGAYRSVFGDSKTEQDLENIPESEWFRVAKLRYWDKCKADAIVNQSVAESFVDWFVFAGSEAVKSMQKIFGIKVDGAVGPTMVGKLNGSDARAIFEKIRYARLSYDRKIAEADTSKRERMREQMKRINLFTYEG